MSVKGFQIDASITDLNDVSTTALSNGDVFVYNSTSGKLEPSTPTPVIFSTSFISTELGAPIAYATLYSAAHGLGVVPKIASAVLVCKTSLAGGYAIGDEVEFANVGSAGRSYNGLYVNATTIGWRTGTNNLRITHKTTGAAHLVTLANWKIKLRAYA